MAASGLPGSWLRVLQQGTAGRWPVVLFVAALVYAGAAVITAPYIGAPARGFLFPMRLFLIAIAPTIAGIAFVWSDRAIDDEHRRRLARILALMVCGFVGIAVVGWVP